MNNRRFFLGLMLLAISATAVAAKDPVYSAFLGGAISGYDPVAYFTQGKPVKGLSEYALAYRGATWKFSSAENRSQFKRTPEKYAPQYGGYCAYAVSRGYTASTDPEAWTIVDGKLYLNYSLGVRDKWGQEQVENIRKADGHWPGVLQ